MKKKATVEEILELQDKGFTKGQIAAEFEYTTIKSLETFMRRNGYFLRDGKFVIHNVIQSNTDNVIQEKVLENKENIQVESSGVIQCNTPNVIQKKENVIQCNTKDVIHCITNIESNPKEGYKIKYLLDKFYVIQDIIRSYNNKGKCEMSMTKDIDMNLPKGEDKRASVWVNSEIWEEFGQLCNQYKEFTKKELLSKALQEFIEKYKQK